MKGVPPSILGCSRLLHLGDTKNLAPYWRCLMPSSWRCLCHPPQLLEVLSAILLGCGPGDSWRRLMPSSWRCLCHPPQLLEVLSAILLGCGPGDSWRRHSDSRCFASDGELDAIFCDNILSMLYPNLHEYQLFTSFRSLGRPWMEVFRK